MSSSDAVNLKKLMKIIYQKEKEVEKYRKQLRDKERNRIEERNRLEQRGPKDQHRQEQRGFSEQDKLLLTRQVHENRDILVTASKKIVQMEKMIGQLQADLEEEQQNTAQITEQLQEAKLELSNKDQVIVQLRTEINLLQNSKKLSRQQLSAQLQRVENLILENEKLKVIVEDLSQQKVTLSRRIQQADIQISKYLNTLNRKSNKLGPKSSTNLAMSGLDNRRDKRIKTQTTLESIQFCLEGKLREIMEVFEGWEVSLRARQREWKDKYEASLCEEGSIDGISRLLKESFMVHSPQDPQFNESVLKRNEEDLLKQLQQECEESMPHNSVEKEKLVELSEVKQSLKMTKEVNAQLYDELSRQEKIISLFKETFKSMQAKKLFKVEDAEEITRIKKAFG